MYKGDIMEAVIKKWGKEKIIKPNQKNKLSDMLDKSNNQNIHKEIKTGALVGKERIAAFESEDEMIDFINDVGKQVYEDKSW